jgi:NADH-quinone oxidoreductase subunit G
LFESDKTGGITYFQPSTDNSEHKEDGALFVVPRHHIFGSEELSMRSPSIVERSAKACITMNEKDAARRGIRSEQQGSISVAETTFRLPIVVSNEMPDGVVGISQGYPGVPFAELPGWGILTID